GQGLIGRVDQQNSHGGPSGENGKGPRRLINRGRAERLTDSCAVFCSVPYAQVWRGVGWLPVHLDRCWLGLCPRSAPGLDQVPASWTAESPVTRFTRRTLSDVLRLRGRALAVGSRGRRTSDRVLLN